jgi:hypothetical protein
MKTATRAEGRRSRGVRIAFVLVMLFPVFLPRAASAQWTVKSADGRAFVNLGFLLQARGECITRENTDRVMQNIYLRRARIVLGGRLDERTTFFLDTESPYVLKGSPTGPKQDPPMTLLDFFGTRDFSPNHRIDIGLILTPSAYNHLQSASSLLAMDYGPYTFLEAVPLQTRTGRDPGAQLRGILGDKLIEYRLGIFEGLRGTNEAKPFRAAGRVTVYPFQTASNAFFYPGTNPGTVRTFALGAAFDAQSDYRSYHGDAYYEQPLAGGHTVTLQADYSLYGDSDRLWDTLEPPPVEEQSVWMLEAGFATLENRLATFLQLSKQDIERKSAIDHLSAQGGLIWFLDGHRQNLKFAVTQFSYDEPPGVAERSDLTQYQLQYQFFYY